jgi:oligopeptide transport system substrate-binding protein
MEDDDVEVIIDEETTFDHDMTLYAKWTPNTYTVTYLDHEGNTIHTVNVTYPNSRGSYEPSSRDGYEFDGWFSDQSLSLSVTSSEIITSNLTLYPRFVEIIPEVYTISFESNGGTLVFEQTYTDGDLFVSPTSPRKANYQFDQWLHDSLPFEEGTPVTSSLTLQATWNPIYEEDGTLRTYAIDFEGFNIHQIIDESSWNLTELITDTLYTLDFDWELAIELGLAEFIGDFTHVDQLQHTYRPSMALGEPVKLDDEGYSWRIQIKNDLSFSDETPITSATFEYSWKELLSPLLLNNNAFVLYSSSYLPLLNAQAYHLQTTETLWSEVGFEIIDGQTFEITLEQAVSIEQVKRTLSYLPLSVVHPASYESLKNNDGTSTTYGLHPHLPLSYGPYVLSSWVDDTSIHFDRIESSQFSNEQYLIDNILVSILESEDEAYQSYTDNLIDLVNLFGLDYFEHASDPNLKRESQSTAMNLFINVDYGRDLDTTNDNPFLKYEELRYALYFGLNRESYANSRSQSPVQHGLVNFLYYSHIDQTISYRQSAEGMEVLDLFASESQGFDADLALNYFNDAYSKAVTDGLINDGEIIQVTLSHPEAPFDYSAYNTIKNSYESIFGTSRFELVLVPEFSLSAVLDSYTYDMAISGVGSAIYSAPLIIQFLYDFATENEVLETKVALDVSIELPNLKQVLINIETELTAKSNKSTDEIEKLAKVTLLLSKFNDDVYEDTLDLIISDLYQGFMSAYDYPNRLTDLNILTAALEQAVIEEMLVIPLYHTYTATLYHETVGFQYQYDHPRLRFGGYQYAYIKTS